MKNKAQSARLVRASLTVPVLILISMGMGCVKKSLDTPAEVAATPTPVPTASKYLYVATGACHGGPNTTFTNVTASNLVYRLNAETGQRDVTLADYWTLPGNPGDSPVGIVNSTNDSILVAVENSTTVGLRRIERIQKNASGARTTFSANITALATQLRSLFAMPSGDLLITRTSGIEYLTQNNIRIGAPYLNPSAAPCATTNTGLSRAFMLPNGRAVVLHAVASQNRIATLAPGTSTTACTTVQSSPVIATSFPVAAFYDAVNKILVVAYSGASTADNLNSIYAYTMDETTGVMTNPLEIYDAFEFPAAYGHLLFAISEMAYDPDTKSVYISTALNTATTVQNYQIEKFTYDPTKLNVTDRKTVLTKSATTFYPYGSDTKCISQMMIAD